MAVVVKRVQPNVLITPRRLPVRSRTQTGKTTSLQIKPQVKVRMKAVSIYLGMMLLGTLLILLYVGQYAIMVQAEYRLSQIKEDIKRMQEENQRFHSEIKRLRAQERIERIARSRLGMVEPKVVKFVESTPLYYENYTQNPKDKKHYKSKDEPQLVARIYTKH